MKNRLYQKRTSKTVRRFLAVLLAETMLLGLCACAGQETATANAAAVDETEAIQPVVVERAAGPEALQTANEATALAGSSMSLGTAWTASWTWGRDLQHAHRSGK